MTPLRSASLRALALALGTAALLPLPAALAASPADGAGTGTQVADSSFDRGPELRQGRSVGTRVAKGGVRLKRTVGTRRYAGVRYDAGVWTSPWVTTAFSFDELIPSWQATTPTGSWIELRARVRAADGTQGSWDTVARWTSDSTIARTTVSGQDDDLAQVSVDTVRTTGAAGATGYQLKVQLLRRRGTTAQPSLDRVGAMASRVAGVGAVSRPGAGVGTVLEVPAYSQMTHRGHYPQWGSGGEAWCSPTSTAMVLQYYGVNPAEAHTFGGTHADAVVDWTASKVYDHGYRGTGNWAFNTAHAGRFLEQTRVTRLRDLREAEAYLTAGTPLIVSVAFGPGELGGAPIRSTAGHLMVLVGLTAEGDVVVNDPAAPSNATVRRTYDRAQFERVWLGGSGGVAYVLED